MPVECCGFELLINSTQDFENDNYNISANTTQIWLGLFFRQKDLIKTMNSGVQGGFVTIGEARQFRLDLRCTQCLFRPLNMVAVAEGDTGVVPEQEEEKASSILQDSTRSSQNQKSYRKKT